MSAFVDAFQRLRHSRPVGLVRYHLYRDLLLAFPRRHACNICGWRGRRFLTYRHPFVLCPSCGSQIRHRLVAAMLESPAARGTMRVDGGRVLHISPEYCLSLVLRRRARRYITGDWATSDADVRMDFTRLPFADGCFDLVINSDTLEHIVDDRAAMAEIHRVLAPGGSAVLTVPQSDEKAETEEDLSLDAAGRSRYYGQHDHVRNYGSDFADRLEAVGFAVTAVSAGDFDAEARERHVLRPPVPLTDAWGWNNRRIYIAARR